MRAALVEIPQPESNWCRSIAANFPRLEVEVLAIASEPGNNCTETVLLQGQDLDAALDHIRHHPHVEDHRVLGRDEQSVQIRLHLGPCSVADTIALTGVAPRLPFRTRQGSDLWFLIGPEPAIDDALDRIDSLGLPRRLLRLSNWPGVYNRLTDNQRRVLRMAADSGYYDYPRKITLSALAKRIGVAKSTLSESLMVIEKKIMVQFSNETRDDGETQEGRPRNADLQGS